MFDGEIVKKKFPFSKNFGLRKFLVQDRVQDKVQARSKTELGLENFHQIFFFFAKSLKMSCLMEKL